MAEKGMLRSMTGGPGMQRTTRLWVRPLRLALPAGIAHRKGGADPRQTSATPPQPGSVERQRGANPRIRIDVPFALLRRVLLGSSRPRPNVEDITR